MALTNELARYLLGRPGHWTERKRLNVAATATYVTATDHAVRLAWLDGHNARRFHYDSMLIADWYATAPRRIKLELIVHGGLGFMEPKRFEAVFLDAVHLRGLTDEQRGAVIGTLRVFLRLHPEMAHRYERYILGFLRSRRHDDRLFGLPLVARLDKIERQDLEIMRACLSSANCDESPCGADQICDKAVGLTDMIVMRCLQKCAADKPCPEGYSCEGGECLRVCKKGSDCGPWEACDRITSLNASFCFLTTRQTAWP